MGKAFRNEKLLFVFLNQLYAIPFSVGGRISPRVYSYIETAHTGSFHTASHILQEQPYRSRHLGRHFHQRFPRTCYPGISKIHGHVAHFSISSYADTIKRFAKACSALITITCARQIFSSPRMSRCSRSCTVADHSFLCLLIISTNTISGFLDSFSTSSPPIDSPVHTSLWIAQQSDKES